MTRPAPTPSNGTSAFWDHTVDEELWLPYCTNCAEFFYYPRSRCPTCRADAVEYRQTEGRAKLASYTTIYRAPSAEYREHTPYINALVDLVEGPRMMTNIIGVEDESTLQIGMELEVTFVETEAEYNLPFFAPAGEHRG